MKKAIAFVFTLIVLVLMSEAQAQESPARVTILYDAFGKTSNLTRGWGYSALIEYAGKRVLGSVTALPDLKCSKIEKAPLTRTNNCSRRQ